ncbi:hypothetical protein OY671_008336 [Metschnikowia pulcherrima]|nr:hypothetical protein OY671_008336 [Metschnikowia pulcherrima]
MPSSVRCTDFALRAGSEISPRSCSRSIALQSKPFQAVPVVSRLSHSRASTASSISSVSVSVSVRESMRGRIANRAAHGIHDPAVSTYLCYATLRYFRLAPPCAESRRRCYGLSNMGLYRKRRRRAPRGWSEGSEDSHDYMQPQPTRASARKNAASAPIVVTDDWPEQVPIGDAELRVIEGAFREESDASFGPLP